MIEHAAAGFPVRTLGLPDDRDCVWAQFTVFVKDRAGLQQSLLARGIPTAVHYPIPLHHQLAYAHALASETCRHSVDAGQVVMSLQMSADLSRDQIDRVVAALVDATKA